MGGIIEPISPSFFFLQNNQNNIIYWISLSYFVVSPQIARFMGPTWGPPGSCRPQMGLMLAPWTLLSGAAGELFRYMPHMDVIWLIWEVFCKPKISPAGKLTKRTSLVPPCGKMEPELIKLLHELHKLHDVVRQLILTWINIESHGIIWHHMASSSFNELKKYLAWFKAHPPPWVGSQTFKSVQFSLLSDSQQTLCTDDSELMLTDLNFCLWKWVCGTVGCSEISE